MAKREKNIRQVHEFMVVGPDAQGLPTELAETPVATMPGTPSPTIPVDVPVDDPYSGERSWVAKWFGPFFSADLPSNRNAGLYLIYVGNYPLFISSSTNILIALSRHVIFSGHQMTPIDLLGREIVQYAHIYQQQVSIKMGLLFEDGVIINPWESIHCYRRAAAAIAFCHNLPCNKYARLSYEFEPLALTNLGKRFPLKEYFEARPAVQDKDK